MYLKCFEKTTRGKDKEIGAAADNLQRTSGPNVGPYSVWDPNVVSYDARVPSPLTVQLHSPIVGATPKRRVPQCWAEPAAVNPAFIRHGGRCIDFVNLIASIYF
jgi:hypothetical protein